MDHSQKDPFENALLWKIDHFEIDRFENESLRKIAHFEEKIISKKGEFGNLASRLT